MEATPNKPDEPKPANQNGFSSWYCRSLDGVISIPVIPFLSRLWYNSTSKGVDGIVEEEIDKTSSEMGVPKDRLSDARELLIGSGVLKISGDKYMITSQAYDAFTQTQSY